MYAETVHLVYRREELGIVQAETGEEVPTTQERIQEETNEVAQRTPISRKTPPRKGNSMAVPSPKKQRRTEVRGLLKKTKPSPDMLKIVCN